MTSQQQIDANRRNSQFSTGPGDTTNTSRNAESHAMRSSRKLTRLEDPEDYLRHGMRIYDDYDLTGGKEHDLGITLVDRMWQNERFAILLAGYEDESSTSDMAFKRVNSLMRYQGANDRTILRVMDKQDKNIARREKQGVELTDAERQADRKAFFQLLCNGLGAQAEVLPSEGEVAYDGFYRRIALEYARCERTGKRPGSAVDPIRKQVDLDIAANGMDAVLEDVGVVLSQPTPEPGASAPATEKPAAPPTGNPQAPGQPQPKPGQPNFLGIFKLPPEQGQPPQPPAQ